MQGCVNGNIDGMGRVTYEHNGECFFLPFGLDDVADSSLNLKPGDKVSFFMATDKRFVRTTITSSEIFAKMFVKPEIKFLLFGSAAKCFDMVLNMLTFWVSDHKTFKKRKS